MARIVPQQVKEDIERDGFILLDKWKYHKRTTTENSQFMDQLVDHPMVGNKLLNFIDRGKTRRYIKDVIVNKYSKFKRQMPRDLDSELRAIVGEEVHEIDWVARDRLSLHRSSSGIFVITARTTYVKWETGLRKVLLYVTRKPALWKKNRHIVKCVAIFGPSGPITRDDQKQLEKAMKLIDVKCVWSD